jgi:hypothetical protein
MVAGIGVRTTCALAAGTVARTKPGIRNELVSTEDARQEALQLI